MQGFSWDRYAECYDALNLLRPYEAMLETVVGHLTNQPGPLLDAGCGTGNLIQRVRQHFPNLDVTGFDSSPHMLARARSKLGDHVRLAEADLNQPLALADDSFDCVCCINTLYALQSPESALQEFNRLLRLNGKLILVTPKQGYENGYILKAHAGSKKPKAYWQKLHDSPEREEILIREACANPELAEKFMELARYNRSIVTDRTFHFFTQPGLVSLVKKVGFRVQSVERVYAKQNLLLVAYKH